MSTTAEVPCMPTFQMLASTSIFLLRNVPVAAGASALVQGRHFAQSAVVDQMLQYVQADLQVCTTNQTARLPYSQPTQISSASITCQHVVYLAKFLGLRDIVTHPTLCPSQETLILLTVAVKHVRKSHP